MLRVLDKHTSSTLIRSHSASVVVKVLCSKPSGSMFASDFYVYNNNNNNNNNNNTDIFIGPYSAR